MIILANRKAYPVSMPWQSIKKLFPVAEIKRKRPIVTQICFFLECWSNPEAEKNVRIQHGDRSLSSVEFLPLVIPFNAFLPSAKSLPVHLTCSYIWKPFQWSSFTLSYKPHLADISKGCSTSRIKKKGSTAKKSQHWGHYAEQPLCYRRYKKYSKTPKLSFADVWICLFLI